MSTEAMTATVDAAEAFGAMQFIWREAEILDRLDYKAWLPLWSQDGLYIIPTEFGVKDHADALNVAYDDAEMREARVKRLRSGFSMSASPPARTVRTISRFVFERDGDVLVVRSAMQIAEYKFERLRTIAADVEHHLEAAEGGQWQIGRKIVTLINADDYLHGIGYLF